MADRIDELIAESEIQDYTPDKRTKDAWESVLGSREGRRMIFDLLGVCHFGVSAFTGDNATTNFLAGKQKVGEYVMDMINSVAPNHYHLMTKEAREDQDYDREQSERRAANDGNSE